MNQTERYNLVESICKKICSRIALFGGDSFHSYVNALQSFEDLIKLGKRVAVVGVSGDGHPDLDKIICSEYNSKLNTSFSIIGMGTASVIYFINLLQMIIHQVVMGKVQSAVQVPGRVRLPPRTKVYLLTSSFFHDNPLMCEHYQIFCGIMVFDWYVVHKTRHLFGLRANPGRLHSPNSLQGEAFETACQVPSPRSS